MSVPIAPPEIDEKKQKIPESIQWIERMDLVENIGSGIKRMRDGMKEYGLSEPVIETGDTWFSIAFPRVGQSYSGAKENDGTPKSTPKSSPKGSPKTKDLILEMILENSKISTAEIGEKLGISKRSVIKQTNQLKETDRLERVGSPRGGYWRIK